MKKANPALLTLALIGFVLVSSTLTVQGAQDEGAWVLVEVIDIDAAEEIAKVNKDYEDVYHHEGSYSRNNYTITQTYIGPSDDYYDPPQIHGEGATYSASFSELPQVIYPDQEITINMSLSGEINNSYYNPSASVKARIGKNDQAYSRFTNAAGEGSFRSYVHNDFASFNENVTAIAPGGSEGDRLEIGFTLTFGVSMETWYVYEWMEVDDGEPEVEESTPAIQEPTPEPYSEPTPENCIDSGVRFSDLAGEVLVRPHDDILAWDMAELDMILCAMDHVKTSYDSYAILSLRDMSTLMLKPESEIILDTMSDKESKVALLAGKIWVNVKKMIKDGTMNIEMSQAVAGIKGTTLVLEEDGATSTLKVLEGTVELSSYAGESILITDGQTVSVTDGTFGPVTNFSVEEEMEIWGATRTDDGTYAIENKTYEENAVVQEKAPRTGLGLILGLLCFAFFGILIVIALVIVFLVVKKKGKTNQ